MRTIYKVSMENAAIDCAKYLALCGNGIAKIATSSEREPSPHVLASKVKYAAETHWNNALKSEDLFERVRALIAAL